MNKNEYENGQQSQESNGSKEFLLGAVVGGLVGAAAALLFAPKSGKELRNDISDQTIVLKEKTEQLKDTAMTKGSELATAAKEKTTNLTQTVSQQSSMLLNKVKDMTKSVEDAVNQETDPESPDDLKEVPTSMAETSSMQQTHTATGEEVQQKLKETQKAFDETEKKINQ